MARVDELVSVSINEAGTPVEFNWRGGGYRVLNRPVRWFTRREWWSEASRVPKGIGSGVLEVEMWLLVASEGREKRHYELAHCAIGDKNQWRLHRVY